MLDPVEKPLDLVAILVEILVYLSLFLAVTPRRNDRLGFFGFDEGDEGIAVEGLVADNGTRTVRLNQRLGLGDVGTLPRR